VSVRCPPCARPDPRWLPAQRSQRSAQRSQRRRLGPCLHGAPARPPRRKPDSGHAGTISTTFRVRRPSWNAMKPRIQCVRTPWIRGSSAPDARRPMPGVRCPMSGARARRLHPASAPGACTRHPRPAPSARARRPAARPHFASCPPHRGSCASVPHSANYIPQISKNDKSLLGRIVTLCKYLETYRMSR